MRRLFTSFALLIFCFVVSYAQSNLSPEQWREDLAFLKNTIHKDYNFLFKKITPDIFDTEVEKLHNAIPKLDQHEIIIGFAKIISLFKYGHTSIGLSGWWDRPYADFHQMPYNIKQFRDGYFIQGTSKEYENALGAKVVKIEGKDVGKVSAAVKPVFPSENDQFFKAYGMSFLGNAEVLHAQGVTKVLKNNITLTLEKDDKPFEVTFSPISQKGFPGGYTYIEEKGNWLDARDNSMDPLYLKNMEKIYYYEFLPEHNAVYVRHSQIQDDPSEDIPTFYDRVFNFIEENNVDKLILDVRLNGGGNNYKNKPIVTGIIKSRVNVPGKFFVIIGGQTYSACQNLVNELHNYTNAVFVGEPTGENINFYGDNRNVTLPHSQIPVRLSYAWWQDKPQWEGAEWLAPHLYVDMSFEDYVSNQDPVLDVALKFSDENFIMDPMAYLTNFYYNGQMDKLQSESERIVNDPMYSFFDFEGEFNRVGYNLLGQGDAQTAIAVFQFVANFFPESANAWDSLAEGYLKAGDIVKAKEYYNKAISLDPDGAVGDNAREMLKRIED